MGNSCSCMFHYELCRNLTQKLGLFGGRVVEAPDRSYRPGYTLCAPATGMVKLLKEAWLFKVLREPTSQLPERIKP
jgi:hypothetical protein